MRRNSIGDYVAYLTIVASVFLWLPVFIFGVLWFEGGIEVRFVDRPSQHASR